MANHQWWLKAVILLALLIVKVAPVSCGRLWPKNNNNSESHNNRAQERARHLVCDLFGSSSSSSETNTSDAGESADTARDRGRRRIFNWARECWETCSESSSENWSTSDLLASDDDDGNYQSATNSNSPVPDDSVSLSSVEGCDLDRDDDFLSPRAKRRKQETAQEDSAEAISSSSFDFAQSPRLVGEGRNESNPFDDDADGSHDQLNGGDASFVWVPLLTFGIFFFITGTESCGTNQSVYVFSVLFTDLFTNLFVYFLLFYLWRFCIPVYLFIYSGWN